MGIPTDPARERVRVTLSGRTILIPKRLDGHIRTPCPILGRPSEEKHVLGDSKVLQLDEDDFLSDIPSFGQEEKK